MVTGFDTPAAVSERLAEVGYLPEPALAATVFLVDQLGKPLLVEGPAGVGKTELAKAVAAATGAELIRLPAASSAPASRGSNDSSTPRRDAGSPRTGDRPKLRGRCCDHRSTRST